MKKKIFSIILSIAIVATMMPAMTMTALAQGSYELKFTVPTNGYLAYSLNEEDYILVTAENTTVTVPAEQSVSVRAFSNYGHKLKSISLKNLDFTMPEEDVFISAEFEKNTTPVTLSDNTKMLLSRYANYIGDSPAKAIEAVSLWFSDPANEKGVVAVGDLMTDTHSIVQNKSADSYRYAKTLFNVTMLGITASFNNVFYTVSALGSEGVDAERCVLDHIISMKECWFNLLDSCEAGEYDLMGSYINEISKIRAETCEECISEGGEGETASCFDLTKKHVTDTSVKGTLLDNNTETIENYAELICRIGGKDRNHLKQYADNHAKYLKTHTVYEYLTGAVTDETEMEEITKEMTEPEVIAYSEKLLTETAINIFSELVEFFCPIENDKGDYMRFALNESPPILYTFLDVMDAYASGDYSNLLVLVCNINEGLKAFHEKGFDGIIYKKIYVDESIQYGSVKADYKMAASGKQITLTVVPGSGFALDSLTVVDVDGKQINIKDGKFTMPDKGVIVNASFSKLVELVKAKALKRNKVKLTWKKVSGATGYVVYGAQCGSKIRKLASTTKTTYNVKKIKGRKLKAHRAYKYYVVAQTPNGNIKSKTIHFITGNTMGKYANVKSIKLKKSNLTLETGKTVALKTVKKIYKNRKHIKKNHGAATGFVSGNPSIATVDSKGIVKGLKTGTTKVYVQDIGGLWTTATITVK